MKIEVRYKKNSYETAFELPSVLLSKDLPIYDLTLNKDNKIVLQSISYFKNIIIYNLINIISTTFLCGLVIYILIFIENSSNNFDEISSFVFEKSIFILSLTILFSFFNIPFSLYRFPNTIILKDTEIKIRNIFAVDIAKVNNLDLVRIEVDKSSLIKDCICDYSFFTNRSSIIFCCQNNIEINTIEKLQSSFKSNNTAIDLRYY